MRKHNESLIEDEVDRIIKDVEDVLQPNFYRWVILFLASNRSIKQIKNCNSENCKNKFQIKNIKKKDELEIQRIFEESSDMCDVDFYKWIIMFLIYRKRFESLSVCKKENWEIALKEWEDSVPFLATLYDKNGDEILR